MISLLIFYNKNIICSIDLNFVINKLAELSYLDKSQKSYSLKGTFEIIFKKYDLIITLKKYDKYLGREESIHELTEIIMDDRVIKHLF